MSDHVLNVVIERFGFARAEVRCTAGPEALCRNMPSCSCEVFYETGKDAEGWFHKTEDNYTHRHDVPEDWCNYCEWLNADDTIECVAPGVKSVHVADVPIEITWNGDAYEWAPTESVRVED